MMTRRDALLGLLTAALVPLAARSQTADVIRIGILQDASGTNSSLAGVNSIHCARMAVEEFAAAAGLKVELLNADHQNKPDIGMSIVRRWIDGGVDAMLEFNNSAIALAVNSLVRDRDKVMLANSFYWDLDDRTRAFSRRVMARTGGEPPNMGQAGAYAAVKHYLQAAASLGASQAKSSGRMVVARMKEMPVDGEVFANASIRADGRVVSDAYLFQVKAPQESSGSWDLLELRATLKSEQAWRPLSEGGCPLVKT